MRVLVASDTIEGLSSQQAGEALASGWPQEQVVVRPVGEAGAGFLTALADGAGVAVSATAWGDAVVSTARGPGWAAVQVEGVRSTEPIPYAATSRPLGDALNSLLPELVEELPEPVELLPEPVELIPEPVELIPEPVEGPFRVYVDLAGLAVHDGGAGLLAGLGATASGDLDHGVQGLAGLQELDLDAARRALSGVELVGVVPEDQLRAALVGLRGITSLAGRAAGTPTDDMLAIDAALDHFAALAAPDLRNAPGGGACGGLGFALLALGGRLTTGTEIGLAATTFTGVDLVVTGCSEFDFAARGGGVVKAVAAAAGRALSPCIAIAGRVVIGAREMRTMGIDAAYAVRDAHPSGADAEAVAATARRVARSWSW